MTVIVDIKIVAIMIVNMLTLTTFVEDEEMSEKSISRTDLP